MYDFAMNQSNPFQSSVAIFEGASRVINVVCNDYFIECKRGCLGSISIEIFLDFSKRKYPSEFQSIENFYNCFQACNLRLYKGRMIPNLANFRMFSEGILRHAEILMRLSSQNKSCHMRGMEDTCVNLMMKKEWIDSYYSLISSNYKNCFFSPLVDDFYEANRIDPFDLTSVGMALPKDFCRIKTVAFDTAFNCKDMYFQRLQYIDSVSAQKVKTDVNYILSLCNINDYSIVKKNIPIKFISAAKNVYDAANDYSPFIKTGDFCYTNANLVSRYIENITSNICERKKKYQIHSGFMFEKRMKSDFDANKYDLVDIKRTKTHREFDVILKEKSNANIINIQCKNFAIDLYSYRENISFVQRRIERVMKRLDAALIKEKKRECELVKELNLRSITFNKIQHIVVSKQQIPSNDEIMDYSFFLKKYGLK